MEILRQAAAPKKFRETIVFTHHYGGSATAFRRHQEFVAGLGYDSVAFDYLYNDKATTSRLIPLVRGMRDGVNEVWPKQLNDVLDSIDGGKFIFSFSFPSCATLHLLSRSKRQDVHGWLCDGGPFMQPWRGLGNFFRHSMPNLDVFRLFFVTSVGYLYMGGPKYTAMMRHWILNWPLQIPILSIRAGRDALVPTEMIDGVFRENPSLNLTVFNLPEAEHMLGLKKFPEIYGEHLQKFLLPLSTVV